MNDKEMQSLSDLKLKAEIEQVGKMIDRAELDGVKPTDKVIEFMNRLNKEVERRANPPVEEDEAQNEEAETEPQDEESK